MKKKNEKARGRHAAGGGVNNKTTSSNQSASKTKEQKTAVMGQIDNQGYPGKGFDVPKKKHTGARKFFKGLGITCGVLLALVLVAYAAGCFYFIDRFWPNSTLYGNDVSLKTSSEAAPYFDQVASEYSLQVRGHGVDIDLTASDIEFSLDSQSLVKAGLEEVKPWMWPLEITGSHEISVNLESKYSQTKLAEIVKPLVNQLNEGSEPPVDSTLYFDENTKQFEVSESHAGTELDENSVMRVISNALSSLQGTVEITDAELAQPLISSDHAALVSARDSANAMMKTDLKLILDGNEVAVFDSSVISQWISLNDDYSVSFNEEALNAWLDETVSKFNTVGAERTYTRPDGKVVTVSGGSYGWQIDGDSLRAQLLEALNNGQTGELVIPILQYGNGFSTDGTKDWGNRYVDVDISEQHAYFYDENGNLVWDADIVTGERGQYDTPTGVYAINNKESPSVLIGATDPATGKPSYESDVEFWMPFKENWVGLHDASWQSAFGGSRYDNGYGSKGCVNLSYEKAAALYNMIQIGDVVVTHY